MIKQSGIREATGRIDPINTGFSSNTHQPLSRNEGVTMIIVNFGEPKDITPFGLDGTKMEFPFTATEDRPGFEEDKHSEHRLQVEVSRTQAQMWGYGCEDLIKVMFAYGREKMDQLAEVGQLRNERDIVVLIPFPKNRIALDKIPNPNGYTHTYPSSPRRKIGF